jgi:protein farnesyltransferase/geranylgeranyltransferase type-1 subunit alpha
MKHLTLFLACLEDDSKNYHAWSHRQWLVKNYELWDLEQGQVEDWIQKDVCNNSAWNQKIFILKYRGF